jgi:predicted AlkP superfamily phosphohydrolase/phosphomutase
MTPLLVFGLDGASLPIFRDYVKRCPGGAFDRMLKEGTAHTLLSTLPYFTAPAWTTIATGLSPARHGMFHWLGRYDPKLGRRPLLSNRHLHGATIWSRIQAEGFRVSVSNFPMEYPAPAVNGRYICGTLAPEDASETTWPRALAKRIRVSQPAFRFEMDKGLTYVNRRDELKAHILEVGENHLRAMFDFGAPERADLLFHVVTVTDRMQHFFWDAYDPAHPLYHSPTARPFEDAVIEAYALAETALARLLDMGRWSNVVIISDHGMGPSWTAFHVDEWLRREAYLVLNEDGTIDMSRSLAYSAQEPECAIYVQRQARDGAGTSDEGYNKVVDEIAEKLMSLCGPNGSPAMQLVHRADAVHSGPFADLSPDIIMQPVEGIHPRPGRSQAVFSAETRLCAGHRPEGVFIGWGEGFRVAKADRPVMRVEDVFPVVSRLSGLTEPAGLDGSVPEGLLRDTTGRVARRLEPDWRARVDGPPEPQAESNTMLNRLRELGYMD